jgi:hypothetical protein
MILLQPCRQIEKCSSKLRKSQKLLLPVPPSSPHYLFNIPDQLIVGRTFEIYKQIVQPFWGLLIDIEDFESKLCMYLEDRASSAKHLASTGKGVSSAWLGMLFAVLAVATNYTELSYHKRVATSQAFGKHVPESLHESI